MEKGFKRLTPEQPVGLRHAGYVISLQKVIKVGIWDIYYNRNIPQELQLSDHHSLEVVQRRPGCAYISVWHSMKCRWLHSPPCPHRYISFRQPLFLRMLRAKWWNWRWSAAARRRLTNPKHLSSGWASHWFVKCVFTSVCKWFFRIFFPVNASHRNYSC